MKLRSLRFTPSQFRVLYDTFFSVGAAAFIFGFSWLYLERAAPETFLGAILLLGFNRLLGVYTRYKVGSGQLKTLVLTISVLLSGAGLWLAGGALPVALLWVALIWTPLVIPRYVLNLDFRHQHGTIPTAVRERGPVVVVGGAGYIGTHVVEQLLKEKYRVRVLDRLIYGKGPLEDFLADPGFELIEGDATDITKLVEAMDGGSAVIHLAGLVGDPASAVNAHLTRHMNLIATRMVKDVALSFGISRFIFASSCSVYGMTDVEVDETSELHPVSLYADSKIASEQELLACREEYFYPTILRFATVFGHSRRPRFDLVANLFTAQAMIEGKFTVHGGDQYRPFIHVRDLARAVVATLKADPKRVRSEIFNVGDPRLNLTISDLAERVVKVVSATRDVRSIVDDHVQDRRNYAVSFTKIQRTLGFQAQTLMEEGIAEMVEAFKRGEYSNYRDAIYSNVAMTQRMLQEVLDPTQSTRMYRPLSEEYVLRQADL